MYISNSGTVLTSKVDQILDLISLSLQINSKEIPFLQFGTNTYLTNNGSDAIKDKIHIILQDVIVKHKLNSDVSILDVVNSSDDIYTINLKILNQSAQISWRNGNEKS